MAASSAMDRRALAAAIDDHRIYFEVERETAQRGEERITVVLHVWLWATIPKGAGSLPGDPGCRAAAAALQAAAAAAVARSGLEPAPDVEPFHWALYASRQVAEADEIRLGVNLRGPPGDEGPAAARERALEVLRRALDEIGVSEGSWRPSGMGAGPQGAPEGRTARSAPEATAARLVPAHAG